MFLLQDNCHMKSRYLFFLEQGCLIGYFVVAKWIWFKKSRVKFY